MEVRSKRYEGNCEVAITVALWHNGDFLNEKFIMLATHVQRDAHS